MTDELNNAQNSTVLTFSKYVYTCSVNASSVSSASRLKPSLTVFDKLLCKNKDPLTVAYLMISYLWVLNATGNFTAALCNIPSPISDRKVTKIGYRVRVTVKY